MARIYRGIIKHGVVVFPDGVNLPEGTVVEVHAPSVADDWPEPAEPTPVERELLAAGLIREIKRPPTSMPNVDRTPIEVKGKPLSEIIIEDRR
jgi:hypothetical protein